MSKINKWRHGHLRYGHVIRILMRLFTITFDWHCFKAWYIRPTNGKIVLHTRQTAHADAVAALPLPGLRRMAEPVGSTRLQIFYRVCIARTIPWKDVHLSAHPSVRRSVCHTPVLCLNDYTYSHFFHQRVAPRSPPPFYFSHTKRDGAYCLRPLVNVT